MMDAAHRFHRAGHHVTVSCFHYDADTVPDHPGIEIRSVRTGPFRTRGGRRGAMARFWRDMPQVARLIPDDVDVIHAHEWPALHAGRLASGRLDVPFVWSRNDHTIWERAVIPGVRHDANVSSLGRAGRALGSVSDFFDARRAAAILCLDEESRRMAQRAYRRPAEVVPAPPADQFFDPPPRATARAMLGIDPEVFLILGVGIMNPHRRFEDLVQALSGPGLDETQTLIIGSDHVDPVYGRLVTERVRQAQLEHRVTVQLQAVDEDHLRAAYAAADVYVFPNDHHQTWGLAPLEALASGTPVIATDASGLASAISSLPGVTIVPVYDPPAITEALTTQVRRGHAPDLEATRAFIAAELGGERYVRRVTAIYDRIRAT